MTEKEYTRLQKRICEICQKRLAIYVWGLGSYRVCRSCYIGRVIPQDIPEENDCLMHSMLLIHLFPFIDTLTIKQYKDQLIIKTN